MNWKIGQTVMCDRSNIEAHVVAIHETYWGCYATIYSADPQFCLCNSISVLQSKGWRSMPKLSSTRAASPPVKDLESMHQSV